MANQEQNPPQQEQPFVVAKQVGFNLEDIILNTNNEVALLYPEHNNKNYFKCVSDFISKCCLRKPFTRSLNMYKDYLVEFWYSAKALENSKVSFSIPTGGIFREVGVNTFRNAIGGHYLPHSSKYVAPPSIDVVEVANGTDHPVFRGKTGGFDQITNKDAIILYSLANDINMDYANIFWEDIIIKLKKKQREKVVTYTRFLSLLIMHKMKEGYGDDEVTLYPTQVFSVHNWTLKPNQPKEHPFIDHMLAICTTDKLVVFKASKTSSKTESVSQGTKPGAQTKHKKPLTLQKNPLCPAKRQQKPPVFTPMDTGMHKEDYQATGGPTSLGVTSEARSNPQLSSGNDASSASTAEADPRNSAPSTDPHVLTDQTKSISKGLETVITQPITGKGASLVANMDSPKDDPVIVVDDSDEDEDDEVHAT
ncbi:hypothetical protein Tco_1029508 [Tanacetum coccineum]|uniref:Uncharacterized protein n=1 Tax=Tanacetum coccineum TaxID=301880 RepID=A0ABQ5G5V4_9ASTR